MISTLCLPVTEIHTLVGAGSAEGGIDAANMLKPALARGKLQVIGATTISEYRKYIEKDAALERRLQPLLIKEPTVDQTVAILEAISDKYGAHHGVRYTPESLVAAARLSERYVTDRFLPDKVRVHSMTELRLWAVFGRLVSPDPFILIVPLTVPRIFLGRPSTCWTRPARRFTWNTPSTPSRRPSRPRT